MSDRERIVSLVLLAALVLCIVPVQDCPCTGRVVFEVVGTPTEDHAEFQMGVCKACKGGGRLSLWDRWFGDPPRAPARPAAP